MALPRWFWNQDAVSTNWAWGWHLKSRQRKDALKLADEGQKHPDPHVEKIARRFSTSRRSNRYFTIEMVVTVIALIVFANMLRNLTDLPTTGGIAAAIVGVAAAIMRHVQASRLSKAYQESAAENRALIVARFRLAPLRFAS